MPPRLPPPYCLQISADPSGDARNAVEPGTVLWTGAPDRLVCAVSLAPDRTLAASRAVAQVALLALRDALAVMAPPERPILLSGGSLLVDGASVAAVRFFAEPVAEDAVPDWAVLALEVDVLGDPGDPAPGLHPGRSSLRDEGFAEVDAARVLQGFCHHLLAWLDRWNDDPGAVERAWRRQSAAGVSP